MNRKLIALLIAAAIWAIMIGLDNKLMGIGVMLLVMIGISMFYYIYREKRGREE